MSRGFDKIETLTPEAQVVSLEQFATFYVKHFRLRNLDILAQDDRQGDITDINSYLFDNSSFHTEELVAGLVQARRGTLLQLVSKLGQTFAPDGSQPAIAWEQWFNDQLGLIPNH